MKIENVKYMLLAQDMDRAVGFYQDCLGLELKSQSEQWTEFTFGDAIIALHGGHDGSANKTGLGLQVDDIDTACKWIAAAGGKILKPPASRPGEPIRLAFLADTEGNEFMLSEWIASKVQ